MLRVSWTLAVQLTCLVPAAQEVIYLVKSVKHYRKSLTDILVGQNNNYGILLQHPCYKNGNGEKGQKNIQFQSLPTRHINTLVKGKRGLKSKAKFPSKDSRRGK